MVAKTASKNGIWIDRKLPLSAQPDTGHNRWHPAIKPVLKVKPGEEVEIETRDACDGQIEPRARMNEVGLLDPRRGHPLTGPVHIEEAEPGDILEIEVLSVSPQEFGFTICSPRYGILKKHMPEIMVARWSIQDGYATSPDIKGVRIPGSPFMGIMGVAPSLQLLARARDYEEQLFGNGLCIKPVEPDGAVPEEAKSGLRTLPPRDNGGNMDVKQLCSGGVLRLPVYVKGALFSTGDAHFAQGDNECCTGIEMGATLRCRFSLLKGLAKRRGIRDAQVYRPRPDPIERKTPIFCTTGQSYSRDGAITHDNLNQAVENALLNMISHLQHEYGFEREQAAIICSVAVDVRISQASNNPNYLATAILPLDIFR